MVLSAAERRREGGGVPAGRGGAGGVCLVELPFVLVSGSFLVRRVQLVWVR
jgi:hypothetical protein